MWPWRLCGSSGEESCRRSAALSPPLLPTLRTATHQHHKGADNQQQRPSSSLARMLKSQWLVGGPPGGSCVCWAAPPLRSPPLPGRFCLPSSHPPPPPSRHKGGDTLGLPYSCSACDSAPESPLPLLSPCRQCCALGRGRLQWWREERRRQSRPSQSGPAPTQRAPGLHHNNNTHDCTQADDTNEPTLTRQSLRLAVWIWYYTIRNTDVHGKTKRLLSPPILIRFTQNSQSRLFSPSPTHFTHFVLPPTSP